MIENELKIAYEIVDSFIKYDTRSNPPRINTLDYRVPKLNGIIKYHWGKRIEEVKPNILEHIVFYLHNTEVSTIVDGVIGLLYYHKIRSRNLMKMESVYKNITRYYSSTNSRDIPLATILSEAIVYSISFSIGTNKINKFGLASDKNRYRKLISDVRSNYKHTSVGGFIVNQEIQFHTLEQAERFEEEALNNLKKHELYSKCKYLFDGYTEAYLDAEQRMAI